MTTATRTTQIKTESHLPQQDHPQSFAAHLRGTCGILLIMSLITGVAYPLFVTLAAQAIFPWQANGSLIGRYSQPVQNTANSVGSELIGQNFTHPGYFWPRPSATSPVPYTAYNADKGTGSSGSNLTPAGESFADAVHNRVTTLKEADPDNTLRIPIDLVTTSASGLDPHESLAAAEYQVHRVAKIRGTSAENIRQLIADNTQPRAFGVLGEPVVNILKLNLSLDRRFPLSETR